MDWMTWQGRLAGVAMIPQRHIQVRGKLNCCEQIIKIPKNRAKLFFTS
jgi:hypothetical protein